MECTEVVVPERAAHYREVEGKIYSITMELTAQYALRAAIPREPVKIGDTAICSECLEEKTIVHLFGGKHPHCSTCDTEIRN